MDVGPTCPWTCDVSDKVNIKKSKELKKNKVNSIKEESQRTQTVYSCFGYYVTRPRF